MIRKMQWEKEWNGGGDREVKEGISSNYLVVRERNQAIDLFTLIYNEREVGPGNGSVISFGYLSNLKEEERHTR